MKARATVLGCATILAVGVSGCGFIRSGYQQSYQRSGDNWTFRKRFPEVDRLFNGFDYGHAIVYERLLASNDAARHLEQRDFEFITQDLLVRPPRVPLSEHAIGPHYVNLLPEVVEMFEWAHMLHRALYDICADTGISEATRDARVARALAYYASRGDLALSRTPKSMHLMEGQPYSLAFRRRAPRFNGLLWSYHWMQMALYEALLDTASAARQSANVKQVENHFWTLVRGLPGGPPTIMPMSAAIAPRFSSRYPAAAVAFDNLHSLHDVIADIMASPGDENAKRRLAISAAAAYRDDSTETTSFQEWTAMATMMGLQPMGGPALHRP